MKRVKLLVFVLCTTLFFTSCRDKDQSDQTGKEMLIYCGITMVNPIKKLASEFEKNITVSSPLHRVVPKIFIKA